LQHAIVEQRFVGDWIVWPTIGVDRTARRRGVVDLVA
jgi:hypothetical protein